MSKAALLLVDIQYDFIDGSLAVPEADEILSPVYALLDNHKWDLDHHPTGHISFASRHNVEPFTTRAVPVPGSTEPKQQEMWPDHCVRGTRGAEIEDGVRRRVDTLGGVVVRKGEDPEVDAYSAFETRCHAPCEGQSKVAKLLIDHGITSLVVVGLATDYCVRASALAALDAAGQADKPWTVTVVKEACRGVDAKKSNMVLEELAAAGAKVVSSDGPEISSLRRS